ncbi:MAG: alpha/beta hydrolase [Gemmatimonadaceae bacterium]|jgi:pimeloyl-ACP methyl ester carboxylesterase|nr:alpha/beta hydrolase [Burkholderiaceae bacterium]MBY0491585.1 alpha/beta hydrolase [Gemmatimonadaceae bacterium]
MKDNELPVQGTQHWVLQDALRLFLWEKCQGTPQGKPVLVLAHGSATAGRESFDLKVPGRPEYSLMDFLAKQGFDVFAPDMRGFGSSTKPEGHITTEQAASDLNAVVDFICKLRGVPQVQLLAWSWGTQYSGQFVMAHPHKVARYAAYAQMHADSPDLKARRERLATFQRAPYIRITEQGWKLRFNSLTPEDVNDPVVMDAFAKSATLVELKSPTGPQVDLLTRQPLIDATKITVPTMLIHGQYDDVADLEGLLPFFTALPNPDKQYTVIPDGGHMLHLQKGYARFQRAVANWFAVR